MMEPKVEIRLNGTRTIAIARVWGLEQNRARALAGAVVAAAAGVAVGAAAGSAADDAADAAFIVVVGLYSNCIGILVRIVFELYSMGVRYRPQGVGFF